MTRLQHIFDLDLFNQMIDQKEVIVRPHDNLPLSIACYGKLTQVHDMWNEVTTQCRGLIFDQDENIIGRGFNKFYNSTESRAAFIDPAKPVEVTKKLDGSLILVANYNDDVIISTKGSFHSEQADMARVIWDEKYSHYRPPVGWTALYELVSPNNRIVVSYSYTDLVLIGFVENATGNVMSAHSSSDWPGPKVEELRVNNIVDAYRLPEINNEEGYVIRQGNNMVKSKFSRYVQLHKLVSNLSERSVWEQLSAGRQPWEIAADLPDEFKQFVFDTSFEFLTKRRVLLHKILFEYKSIVDQKPVDRKTFAMLASQSVYRPYLFLLFDQKPVDELIWKSLRPVAETYTKKDIDNG